MIGIYTLKARLYPMVIVFLPIILLGIIHSIEFESYIHAVSSIGIVGALTYLFSQIGRDQGKRKEKDLWQSWGGAPTTQILRFSDARLDVHTKTRYHLKLQTKCPAPDLPDQALENNSPMEADEIYAAWSTYLRGQTRDTKKFSLLFKENISYGFRRNLWGLKRLGILVTSAILMGNYTYWVLVKNSFNPALFPKTFVAFSILSIVLLLFWIFICTRAWVSTPAFAYAERLTESIDAI